MYGVRYVLKTSGLSGSAGLLDHRPVEIVLVADDACDMVDMYVIVAPELVWSATDAW